MQTRYEDAVNADANLQNLLEVTIPNAVSEWEIQQQQLAEQKAQEAADQVAQQDQTEQQIQQPDTPITDQPVQQPEVTQPVKIAKGEKSADAKRIFGVMGLGVKTGEEVTITVEGADEEKAIAELEAFFKENL